MTGIVCCSFAFKALQFSFSLPLLAQNLIQNKMSSATAKPEDEINGLACKQRKVLPHSHSIERKCNLKNVRNQGRTLGGVGG